VAADCYRDSYRVTRYRKADRRGCLGGNIHEGNGRMPDASVTRMEGMLRCSVMRERNICRRALLDRYDAQTKIEKGQSALVAADACERL